MEQAQIVFSPYNYLIDPRIRQSMKIVLRGNIIMLDEAHNIEDSAREAASGTFSQESFRLALVDCEMVRRVDLYETNGVQIERFLLFPSTTGSESQRNDETRDRGTCKILLVHDGLAEPTGSESEERRDRQGRAHFVGNRIRGQSQFGWIRV